MKENKDKIKGKRKEQMKEKKVESVRKEIEKLEKEGKKICKKKGHSKMFYTFWGYVHCGRCSEQMGDKLGSIFPDADKMLGIGCNKKPCAICDPIRRKLSKFDKKILKLREKLNKLGYAI